MVNPSILLIISGGIAAYKALDLIRLLKKSGRTVRCILTKGGTQFVTPLSVAALSENHVYTDLWSLKDETEMGHIRLSREADLIVVAPASANIIARMAQGMATDLASTALLAADKPVLLAPAMNHRMWHHPATQHNLSLLKARGVHMIGPDEGDMACGEYGLGRMSEPADILSAIEALSGEKPLEGYTALVTAGPTHEPIDPVRFIGNRSSGKQGFAIAGALAEAGARVTLISGPVDDHIGFAPFSFPENMINRINVETAADMQIAAEKALPADIAVCAAAVGDWTPVEMHTHKMKKQAGRQALSINLRQNPDILHGIATGRPRPDLVIGFAAETENLLQNAARKRTQKQCDWLLANDVQAKKVFGQDENHVYLFSGNDHEDWGTMSKTDIARKLITYIGRHIHDRNSAR